MLTNFSDFEHLNEGLSKILYHFTHLSSLLNILHENKFQASINIGSDADKRINKNKFYFFSTQRTKGIEGYGKNHGAVCIVLDGNLLAQRYKGAPIDYWEHSKNPKDYKTAHDYNYALTSGEREDRIIMDSPTIDNAKKYIKEIHIKINRDYMTSKDIEQIQKDLGDIPLYLYDDDKSFKLLIKKNAKELKDLNLKSEIERYESVGDSFIYTVKVVAPYYIYDSVENEERIFSLIQKYIEKNDRKLDINDIMDEIIRKRNALIGWGIDVAHLKSYFHNERGNSNPFIRELFKLFVNDMKKFKVNDINDYVKQKTKTVNPATKKDVPIQILWNDDKDRYIKLDSLIWEDIDPSEFWQGLSKDLQQDTRTVALINDNALTYKKFIKMAMGMAGKYKLMDILKKYNISIKKITPDDLMYKNYKLDSNFI